MRRFLLFIVLTVAIMATWTYFFPPPKPAPRPAVVQETPNVVPGTEPGTEPGPAPNTAPAPGAAAPAPDTGKPPSSLPAWAVQAVQAAAEEQVVLEDAKTR